MSDSRQLAAKCLPQGKDVFWVAQRFTAAIKAEFDLKGHDFSRAANATQKA
jgi:hypothetical protein